MKSITLLVLLAISTSLFSQQNNPGINTDYLKKSKNQKKIALIMLGGGAALTITAFLIPKGEIVHSGFLSDDYENDGIKNAFGSPGVLAMLGSIPLFIASSKNKKKAGTVSIRNEQVQIVQKTSFAYKPVPSVCLTIRL